MEDQYSVGYPYGTGAGSYPYGSFVYPSYGYPLAYHPSALPVTEDAVPDADVVDEIDETEDSAERYELISWLVCWNGRHYDVRAHRSELAESDDDNTYFYVDAGTGNEDDDQLVAAFPGRVAAIDQEHGRSLG